MPKRRSSAKHKSSTRELSKVMRIKKHKTREEEFELLLRSAVRLKTSTARAHKKQSAA